MIKLVLAYDGTEFHGWARQPGVRTVEGVVLQALGKVLPDRPVLSVAGRTDAGVHAEGQVISFEAPGGSDLARLQRALNAMLSPEVVIREARRAPAGFDARRSATGREYRYRMDTGSLPDPFTARFVWHRPGTLLVGKMRAAARELQGEHDFASFCRPSKPPASTIRTLRRLAVARRGDRVEIRAVADGFLHQMVRSLVGTLVVVGQGGIQPKTVRAILEARDRSRAGPVAPPHGLSLIRVVYGRRSSIGRFGDL